MTTVVLLSLCAAIAYGLSDFVGGVVTRRASAWAVAAVSQTTATLLTLAWMAGSGFARLDDTLLWGVLAGIGSGAGNVFIFRGLSGGRMTIVAPISAVAAATLPVLVGLATGERPAMLPAAGVVMALPAIWLVAGGRGVGRARRFDLLDGTIAGAGFGMQFSALGQVPSDAGLTPLAVSQAVSVVAIVMGAAAASAPWMPRDRFSRYGSVAGVLAGVATICFQVAAQSGLLTIAAVLTSLYPAVTVLLAALVMRERFDPAQGIGLALAAAAVALIASG